MDRVDKQHLRPVQKAACNGGKITLPPYILVAFVVHSPLSQRVPNIHDV